MLRVCSFFALAFGILCLTAFRTEDPKCNNRHFSSNAIVPRTAACSVWHTASPDAFVADTNIALNILMLNYSAYDSAYATKVRQAIQGHMPSSSITEYWEGSPRELGAALATHDVVVAAYPYGGSSALHATCGKLLAQYVRQGGVVIFTGTDDYQVIREFGLLDVKSGYFCQDPVIHDIAVEHPILEGTREQFPLSDFAYPLDIVDRDFVTLVDVLGYDDEDAQTRCWMDLDTTEVSAFDVRGFPVIGYKPLGLGKVIYLGMEYYHSQAEPVRILVNAICWAARTKNNSGLATANNVWTSKTVRRSEEILHAGSGVPQQDIFDLKIYPNPYFDKASLDIELKNPTTLEVEMTDESGRIAAAILPQKSLNAGFYRLELPNLPTGVYFVRCKTGERTTVRKVVKAEH